MDVLEHPTRYGQVVPYWLLDHWIALQENKTAQGNHQLLG